MIFHRGGLFVADKAQQTIIGEGVEAWNNWRRSTHTTDIDLSGIFLSKAELSGADLSKANLSMAYLFEANLSKADLSGAIQIGRASCRERV